MKQKCFSAEQLNGCASWLDSLTPQVITADVPKDFYTAKQIAKMRGISLRRVSELLSQQLAKGAIVCRKYRAKSGLRTLPIEHYGPAKTKSH